MNNPAIVFDLDGTLIDSVHDVRRALNRTLEPLGRRTHDVDEVRGYLGCGAHVLMERALRSTGDPVDDDYIKQLTDTFLQDYKSNPVVETKVFPHTFECLETLKSRDWTLAICTNKPSITAAPVLDMLKLTGYFDAIVCGDQVERRKPHGDHILETLKVADSQRRDAVMVGDSENDIDAAKHANVPSVAVTFGYSLTPHEELGADVLIDTLQDLPHALDSLLS